MRDGSRGNVNAKREPTGFDRRSHDSPWPTANIEKRPARVTKGEAFLGGCRRKIGRDVQRRCSVGQVVGGKNF